MRISFNDCKNRAKCVNNTIKDMGLDLTLDLYGGSGHITICKIEGKGWHDLSNVLSNRECWDTLDCIWNVFLAIKNNRKGQEVRNG